MRIEHGFLIITPENLTKNTLSPMPLGNDRAYVTSLILETPESLSGILQQYLYIRWKNPDDDENTILSMIVKFLLRNMNKCVENKCAKV